MAEFDPHETVGDAVDAVARGMVKRSRGVQGDEVEYFPVSELIAADNHASNKAAAGKSHFGLRMSKCIPPGGG